MSNSTVTTTAAATATQTQQSISTSESSNNNGNGQMQGGMQGGGMQGGGMYYPPPPPPPGPECFDEYGRPNGKCGPLPPQFMPTNNQSSDDKSYVKYVLPVIGVLFIIALFGVYLYLLTNKKKKKKYNNNNNMSYSLPKISVDDKDAAQSGNDYINKLGQYKTPIISDYDSAYRSPVAGSLSSFNMTQPGYNGLNGVGMGNISMGNLSSAAYLGTQPIMVDPLYETSLNYSMKGAPRKQVGNKSLNNISRYAGSDIGINPSVGDPLSNLVLSPIEPTSFNGNTNKPY